jgi:hypothetical protein
MNSPPSPYSTPSSGSRGKSSVFRWVLGLGAIALGILPALVTAYGVLPAYRMHARFLLFYAPFVCLLILAYLIYIRDSLGRLMLARFLQPAADLYPYPRQEPLSTSLKHWMVRVGSVLLAVAPGLLVVTSFYCISRYTTRLNQSVALASGMYNDRLASGGGIETGNAPSDSREKTQLSRAPSPAGKTTLGATASGVADPGAARAHVLGTAGIDDIPFFGELTLLYIGAFATASVALLLMALKEHAKTTMGLSEEELMRGWSPRNDS